MTHFEMIDAVNDAKTKAEHDRAEDMLDGWRNCADQFGIRWNGIRADQHTMERFGNDRPMCCGVLLDWEPA